MAGGLGAGGVKGVGHAVVLAGLPDDRIAVVLAAVVDGHPHPERKGGLPVADRLAAKVAALVGGHAVVGVEPVEGLLSLSHRVALEFGVECGKSLARRVWSWRWRASRSPPKPPAIWSGGWCGLRE